MKTFWFYILLKRTSLVNKVLARTRTFTVRVTLKDVVDVLSRRLSSIFNRLIFIGRDLRAIYDLGLELLKRSLRLRARHLRCKHRGLIVFIDRINSLSRWLIGGRTWLSGKFSLFDFSDFNA